MPMELVLKALDSPRRRAILRLVWNEERPAGDIHRALGDVTFGAVSQQLRLLTEENHYESLVEGSWKLIVARADGSARVCDLRRRRMPG